MKRLYIITGAKGHLASTIIQYLRNEDCHIRGLILPTENGEDDRQLTYYRGDISQPETLAESLKKGILEVWKNAEVEILPTRGLCSYYAERGGLIVSY